MVDTPEKKKRGAPLKANKLTGKIAARIPQELEDWLKEEGQKQGLDAGSFARTILMKEMHQAKKPPRKKS